jgi:hypothetical protein
MRKVYFVPDQLLPVTKEIYRFLLDRERDVRFDVDNKPPVITWFQVLNHPRQKDDGILRVTGGINPFQYRLYINSVSAAFEVDNDMQPFEIEQCFYVFIQVIMTYRNIHGLPPMNTHFLHGLAIEDSPPVNAENYMEIPPEDESRKLGALIGKNFNGVSFTERHGCFCYYICANPCRSYNMPMRYVPASTALLNSFMAAFPFKQVKLFATRWTGTQRLYFVTGEGRLYCCKTDGSREFLERHVSFIFRALSASSFKSAVFPPAEPFAGGFRFTID